MFVRLLTAALALLAFAAPAAARNVPRGFYGVSYDRDIPFATADAQAEAWERMRVNGVESARAVFSWREAQDEQGDPFSFAATDHLVANATANGIELLPIVMDTPVWARARLIDWWPEETADFARYMDALVARYGPGGSFWGERPELPQRPLRYWQIFNEPGRTKRYAPLLRTAHRRVALADPGAKIVLAGLTGTPGSAPWDVLRYQYRRGRIKRWFDVAALNLYTGDPDNVDDGVRLFRREMKRRGDGAKPVWLTEFGITASKGHRTTAPRSQRTLRTTDEGMASFLFDAYRTLARRDRRLHLKRAYWYTWASSYEEGGTIFHFAGLNRYVPGVVEAMPALDRYRESALRDQGG